MTPSRAHYFFAKHWPVRLWMAAIGLASGLAALLACAPGAEVLKDWAAFRAIALVVAMAMFLGWCVAILAGWFVLGPIYYDRAVKNGAPFQVGDRVRVLVGPYRDRVSRVYALWQANTVRVELGEREKEKLRDIFSPNQLLREDGV